MNNLANSPIIKCRGGIHPHSIVHSIEACKYGFLNEQKMGFHLSYETQNFQFHAVDRFASFPLYYCIKNGVPYVSEKIDELLPYLQEIKFDPIGFITKGDVTGGIRNQRTPFAGVKRIMPGHYLEYKNGTVTINCYWSFEGLKEKKFQGSYEEAAEGLGFLVKQAVLRCYNFAPDCALHLSGGMDSGMIASFIAQFSSKTRHTYAAHNHDDHSVPNKSERSYIQKYQKYYPHLLSHNLKFNSSTSNELFPAAENWLFLSKSNYECLIAEDVKKKNIKFILTGLGGDELASFQNSEYSSMFRIHNDFQAQLYKKWMVEKRAFWSNWLRAFISPKGKSWEFFKYNNTFQYINNPRNWFRSEINKLGEQYYLHQNIWMGSQPASFNYRLTTLQRKYFTARSDVWNFIGRNYDVDYLHPLLDADVVEFCATLPIAFHKRNNSRQLIKKALSNYLPAELLEGSKRPVMVNAKPEKIDLKVHQSKLQEKLNKMNNTFAATVFDFQKMESKCYRLLVA